MESSGIDREYTLKALTELMIRDSGIHEGLYDIAVKFQVAVGAIGPSPDSILPGAMIGVDGIGLRRVKQAGPFTTDAAVVNPKKPARKKTVNK